MEEAEVRGVVTELAARLGDRLASVVVWGSHATDRPHPRDPVRLCIELDPCDAATLRSAGAVFAGPVRRARMNPYLVAKGELAQLGDVFPLKIHAMRARHRVLHGPDPLEAVRVGRERLRIGVEQGLRNHLVRLRTLLALHDGDALARHTALLAVAEAIGDEVLGLEALGSPIDPPPDGVPGRLEALRDGHPSDERLMSDALDWLGRTVDHVDRMEDA
jgi:hypothetical protein